MLAAGALFVEIVVVVGLKASGSLSHETEVSANFGTPAWIGRVFLTDHLLAFEITSIVLLIAAVGGVILGSHTKRAGLMCRPRHRLVPRARGVPVRDRRARRARSGATR